MTLTSAEVVSATLLQKPTLEEKIVMRSGTSAVDWNVKEISELFLDCDYSQYLVVGHHQKILLLELGGITIQSYHTIIENVIFRCSRRSVLTWNMMFNIGLKFRLYVEVDTICPLLEEEHQ